MRTIAAAHLQQPNRLMPWTERQVLHCIFSIKICFRDAVPLVSRDCHLQGIMLEGLDAILNAVIAGKEASGCVIFGTK